MTRVVRHASALDRWQMVHAAPDPRLDGYVLGYCDYDERTASFVRRRELPSERVVAIVNLGAPIRVRDADGRWTEQAEGFFSGISDTYAITETCGAQRGVQIDLTPVGAHLLLRLPMHELTQELVTLEALFGRAGLRLREQLGASTAWDERFAILDDFFLERLDDALSPVPSITRALTRLRATQGSVAIDAVVNELGCSRRYLTARFREQVGVAPKLFARILRFNHALALIDTPLSWGEISQVCGYYDQAHLIRDFNQFAGSPPTEFARRRLPGGGGVKHE